MKTGFCSREKLKVLAALLCWLSFHHSVEAATQLSNLDNRHPEGSLGDIQYLQPEFVGYDRYTIPFTTGGGLFNVNSITLEFLFDTQVPTSIMATQWIRLRLFEDQSPQRPLGSFGNPVPNAKPTQWPNWSPTIHTEYVDFSPLEDIRLKPSTEYSLLLTMPTNSPGNALLLFSMSSNYVAPSGWQMSATTSHNPYAAGEYLKFAIDATLVPEPNAATLVITWFVVSRVRRRATSKVQTC